jgi:F0F1-type ATP synthase delta subunit
MILKAPDFNFVVPKSVVTRADSARLIRELEMLDNDVRADTIRHRNIDVSAASNMLVDLAEAQQFDLADQSHRLKLIEALRYLKAKAPIMHVTFAEHAHPEFLQQIIVWARQELHPLSLIHVGLQPGIVAGCIVRTPSHIYDFSIQHILRTKRPLLLKYLKV